MEYGSTHNLACFSNTAFYLAEELRQIFKNLQQSLSCWLSSEHHHLQNSEWLCTSDEIVSEMPPKATSDAVKDTLFRSYFPSCWIMFLMSVRSLPRNVPDDDSDDFCWQCLPAAVQGLLAGGRGAQRESPVLLLGLWNCCLCFLLHLWSSAHLGRCPQGTGEVLGNF